MSKEKSKTTKEGISRKDFLKGIGTVGAVGAATTITTAVGMPAKDAYASNSDVNFKPHKRFEVDKPVYEIVGPVKRYDERDIIFARREYLKKFPDRGKKYWAPDSQFLNAKFKDIDYDTTFNTPGLGRVGSFADLMMTEGQDFANKVLAREDIVDGPVEEKKVEMTPERAAEKIKGFAKHLGADLVTIGPLNQEWVYSNVGRTKVPGLEWGEEIKCNHKYAISVAVAMSQDMLKTGPVVAEMVETTRAYAELAYITVILARYIRLLGYPARAHNLDNYQLMPIPVAIDSGMGEPSRAGILITKEFGTAIRLSTVTTDMPLAIDKPVNIKAKSFCENCKLCADNCPSGAVPAGEQVVVNGTKRWVIDAQKCFKYWNECGTDCGMCITVCPWNKPDTWLHNIASEMSANFSASANILVPMEKTFYGEFSPRKEPNWLDKSNRDYIKLNQKYKKEKA